MGSRYLITGVQLGMLEVMPQGSIGAFLGKVTKEQFVFESQNAITADAKYIAYLVAEYDKRKKEIEERIEEVEEETEEQIEKIKERMMEEIQKKEAEA